MPSITPSLANYGAGELPNMPGALSWDSKHETRAGFSSTLDGAGPSHIDYFPKAKNHVPLELFRKIAGQLTLKDVWKLGSTSKGHAAGIQSLIEVASGVNTLKDFLFSASPSVPDRGIHLPSPEGINDIFDSIFTHLSTAECSSQQRTEVLTVLGKATSLLPWEAIKKNNTLLLTELKKNSGDLDQEKVNALKGKLQKLSTLADRFGIFHEELEKLKKSWTKSGVFYAMYMKVHREFHSSMGKDIFSFNEEAGIRYWPPFGTLMNAIENEIGRADRSILMGGTKLGLPSWHPF